MKRSIVLILLIALTACNGLRNGSTARKEIIIASKNFTESIILAEILAQKIEATTKQTVVRKFNLGGTFICHEALIADQIDIYPEYSGTALTAILKLPPEGDPKAVYQKIKAAYEKDFQVTATAPFGFNNTFAILVRIILQMLVVAIAVSIVYPLLHRLTAPYVTHIEVVSDYLKIYGEIYGVIVAFVIFVVWGAVCQY